MTVLTAIKPRAKFPQSVVNFSKKWSIDHASILSTNPKTDKSEVQTYILHLSPAESSGFNVCPGAHNCKKICLHFAGNPAAMNAKAAARLRRTHAFYDDRQNFMLVLISSIVGKILKQPNTEPIAIRLNGTSDICWENIPFSIDAEFSRLLNERFGLAGNFAGNWENIFSLFNHAEKLNYRRLVYFYDYTKLSRDWEKCKALNYHLTFSFDGWDNKTNLRIAARALQNGINIAAAFDIKKGQDLPYSAYFMNRKLRVHDGDLSDFRPSDPQGYHIIGLRFKLPRGIKYTPAEKKAFCFA